uniref:Uncharacterized protein MANES_11G145500 n=1 Tax=Rhizophora mucronata TaxID=61149 RepID=A0A2P2K0D4_RHIMU
MATSKRYFAKQNYRFLSGDQPHYHQYSNNSATLELDESDIYNNSVVVTRSNSPEFRKAVQSSRKASSGTARLADNGSLAGGRPASLPVNIPDWSKILKDEYRRREIEVDDCGDDEDDEDCFVGGVRIPPHELLARTRVAPFSVHEGIGRTLKGRDLSRVRNAIWEKIGFQD